MCLTEPLRYRPGPAAQHRTQADGTTAHRQQDFHQRWRARVTANIVHLVLACLPDTPKGQQRHQPVVVPKFKVNADGSPGRHNPHLLHGLGAQDGHPNGNATAQIAIDGAIGTLVEPANKGLAGHVRDDERRPPGRDPESLGLTEVAFQNAAAYAKERIQMRSRLSGQGPRTKPAPRIIVHPDVRKMLVHRQGLRRRRPCTAELLHAAAGQVHSHPDEKDVPGSPKNSWPC